MKLLKFTSALLLLITLFRGPIYRQLVTYTGVGSRPEFELTDQRLIERIEAQSKGQQLDFNAIVIIANQITTNELKFTTRRASKNPNELAKTNRANCIGYAALFNSIANYLIRENELDHIIRAEHKIGKLALVGIDLHQFFSSPFFKDHDFNELMDLQTGAVFLVDPSVSDYLWINEVSGD